MFGYRGRSGIVGAARGGGGGEGRGARGAIGCTGEGVLRVEVAEGEKVEVFAVAVLFDCFVDVLVGEEFEDEWEKVGVEKELGEVLEFQNVYSMVNTDGLMWGF